MKITESNIKMMSPNAALRIVEGIVHNQHYIFDNGINSSIRLCHFMAQIAHESAHFRVTREFASGKAYEGRRDLGNIREGDGVRYRGRGLIQTTGRANYQFARDEIRKMISDAPDFESDPIKLEEFPWALLSAVSYWRRRKINRLADNDDLIGVTKRINGGTNGLSDRRRYLQKAKSIWSDIRVLKPVLQYGDRGEFVEDLQIALVEAGFAVSIDGIFGRNTESAVKEFQRLHDMTLIDGIVGPLTWAKL